MEKRDGFLRHQVKSFGYAIEGIVYSFKKGSHFKIHTVFAILVFILGVYYSIDIYEWLAIILISCAVIATEAMNTAVEETCDILQPETHPRARLAKHCAAGAVLILSIGAIVIGILVFAPKIIF